MLENSTKNPRKLDLKEIFKNTKNQKSCDFFKDGPVVSYLCSPKKCSPMFVDQSILKQQSQQKSIVKENQK